MDIAHDGQKEKNNKRSEKYYTENKRSSNANSTKNRGWTQVFRKVSSSYSISATRCVTL